MVRAIIIAAGQSHDEDCPYWTNNNDLIIAADGGAARALSWGLVPHLVVGDMDSLPDAERMALEAHGCRFIEHPRAKDETDLELALAQAVGQGAQEIIILGALGGRLDHTLSNLLLLALPILEGLSVRIVSGEEEAVLVRSGEAISLKGQPGDLVSLLPLGGDAQGVTTMGLAWTLEGDILRFGVSRGVSNEMTAPVAQVELERGCLWVVHGPAQGD